MTVFISIQLFLLVTVLWQLFRFKIYSTVSLRRRLSELSDLCDETLDGCLISTAKSACGTYSGGNLTITNAGSISCANGGIKLELSGSLFNYGSVIVPAMSTTEIEATGFIFNEVIFVAQLTPNLK